MSEKKGLIAASWQQGAQNAEDIKRFLLRVWQEQLPDDFVVFWDNARIHRDKLVKTEIEVMDME